MKNFGLILEAMEKPDIFFSALPSLMLRKKKKKILEHRLSECCSQTCSVSITWETVRNANPTILLQTYEIKLWGWVSVNQYIGSNMLL